MYKNINTTLNYFALAMLCQNYTVAILIAEHLYKRTMVYNHNMYKTKENDRLYQKSINPEIKIKKIGYNLFDFLLESG